MLILAVLQGLTEFLPVSSSGHLVLAQNLLQTREGDLLFDVVLHLGTLGAVVAIYRQEVKRLLRLDAPARAYVLALVIGTLPAVFVGLVFKARLEALFHSPRFAAAGLLMTALILLTTRFARQESGSGAAGWEPRALPWHKALLIGCAQAFAILPGISRSGSTIAASLWLQVPRAEAARFSFLLSVPAISGALVLQLADRPAPAGQWPQLALAAAAAFAVGLLALRWTALAVVQAHFWKFSFYCAAAGVAALLILG